MSTSIRTLDLPSRVVKTLTAAGINKVSDIPMRRDDELLSLRGVTADVVHKLRMASGRELSGKSAVEPETAPAPEPPWYQQPDWWEGLPDREIWSRIAEIDVVGAWIAVPSGFLPRAILRPTETFDRREPCTEPSQREVVDIARATYMELIRAKGYSTEHAKHAWAGAVEFVRQGRKAQEDLHPGREVEYGSGQEAK